MSLEPAQKRARRGMALAVLAAVLAAAFLVAIQEATARAPRTAVVLGVLLIAAVLNGVSIPLARTSGGSNERGAFWLTSVVLAVLTVLGNVGVAAALGHLHAGVTSVLLQTQIFIVAGLGWLFLREPITVRFVIGAAMTFVGLVVMRMPAGHAEVGSLVGVGWVLLASASFGAMLVVTRAAITRIEPVTVNAVRLAMAVGALALWPGTAAAVVTMTPQTWALVAAAAFFGPFASRLCLMFALKYISASHTKLVSLLSPLFAFALAIGLHGVLPSLLEVVGSMVILVGIGLPVGELLAGDPTPRETPKGAL